MFDINLSSSDVIAASAAFVSACALGATIWQGYIARKHNLLSVRPNIEFVIRIGRTSANEIAIRNFGLGPALLKTVTASINAHSFTLSKRQDLERLSLCLSDSEATRDYFVPVAGSAVAANEEFPLLRIRSPVDPDTAFQQFVDALPNLRLDIEYTCMYGHCYNATHDGSIDALDIKPDKIINGRG